MTRPASAAPALSDPAVRSSKLNDAGSKVSAFLSESRIIAERVTLCKHSGCAFLCTGLAPKHCCRMCARSPGAHGPKCQRRMLPCATPCCEFAMTGITERHCCKACELGRDHGPQCWCLKHALAAADGDEGADSADEGAADGDSAPPDALDACQPCAGSSASSTSQAAAAAVSTAAGPSALGWAAPAADEPVDVSDAELAVLQETVDGNMSQLATNAAIIQALKEALNKREAA